MRRMLPTFWDIHKDSWSKKNVKTILFLGGYRYGQHEGWKLSSIHWATSGFSLDLSAFLGLWVCLSKLQQLKPQTDVHRKFVLRFVHRVLRLMKRNCKILQLLWGAFCQTNASISERISAKTSRVTHQNIIKKHQANIINKYIWVQRYRLLERGLQIFSTRIHLGEGQFERSSIWWEVKIARVVWRGVGPCRRKGKNGNTQEVSWNLHWFTEPFVSGLKPWKQFWAGFHSFKWLEIFTVTRRFREVFKGQVVGKKLVSSCWV